MEFGKTTEHDLASTNWKIAKGIVKAALMANGVSKGFFTKKKTPAREKEFAEALTCLGEPARKFAMEVWG